MTNADDRMYHYGPSGLPCEAVAYVRGQNPDTEYRILKGQVFDRWTVPHFDIGGFDTATGQRTTTGILTDFLNSDLIWPIVHKRIRRILTRLGVGSEKVQWLDACLHYQEKESVGEYFVANLLDVRSAVNEERSKYAYAGKQRSLAVVVLRKEAIQGADIFRINEWHTRVYFSPRLRNALSRAKVTGVAWGWSRVE